MNAVPAVKRKPGRPQVVGESARCQIRLAPDALARLKAYGDGSISRGVARLVAWRWKDDAERTGEP